MFFNYFVCLFQLLKPIQFHHPSTKENLVSVGETHYADNPKLLDSLHHFDQFYSRSDALQWCFCSTFPSHYLHQALRTRQLESLDHCRFLVSDVSRILQQSSKHKSNTKLYRGMKLSKEYLDQLEEHCGQLICYKGYLTCTKSRKIAVAMANAPDHRSDLIPVLFKITADKSSPMGEISSKNESTKIIFDFYTTFRVIYVVREEMTTIKLEYAVTDGKGIAKEYLNKQGVENVINLLNHCSIVTTLPRRLPPIERSKSSKKSKESEMITEEICSSVIPKLENEQKVMDLIISGDIDQAIDTFQRLKHVSAQLLINMGTVYVEKKGDFDSAMKCFKKALVLKEKVR